MHRAESILQSVETTLTGLTTTGTNIQRGRVYPIETTPALSVYMGSDDTSGDYGATNVGFVDRVLEVIIRSHIKLTSTLDTDLNKIRAEVYAAMMADYTLGLSYVINTWLVSDAQPSLSADSEQPTATQDMTYRVHYRHSYASAEA